MKDLPPRPQPPQAEPFVGVPHELRLIRVVDEPVEAADGRRSVRRRLFAGYEVVPTDADGRPRWRRTGLDEEAPLEDVCALEPQPQPLEQLAAEEAAAASRRWNFDFENERPLEGQWLWEKVGDSDDGEADKDSGPQQAEPADRCPSPQR